jgi:hypothetical protein
MSVEIPPRLLALQMAGSSIALFPLLATWPTEELEALIQDCDVTCEHILRSLNDGYGNLATQAEYFFNPIRSRHLDEARKGKEIEIVGMFSEIAAVALYEIESRKRA